MRAARLVFCILAVMMLAGCDSSDSVVGSVQPLFTSSDLVFDSALAGVWKSPGTGASESVILRPRGTNGYTLISRDDEGREEARFEAWLVNLHGEVYLDLLPETANVSSRTLKLDLDSMPLDGWSGPQLKPVSDQLVMSVEPDESAEGGRAYKTRFIRLHWFYKVRTDGRTMRLTGLNQDWLRDEIKEGRILMDHQGFGQNSSGFILTAPTSELQRMVLDYAFDPEAFPEDVTSDFVRAAEE